MVGIDIATNALRVARDRIQDRGIQFAAANAHCLPFKADRFDAVQLQSVLHHDDDPTATIREAFRVAPEISIHEPNGNNLGLKLIEKTSRYHLEHGEKSYSTRQIRRWIEQCGGRVVRRSFGGLVPMFAPDWLARATKSMEPLLERTPLLSGLGCAVYVVVARRLDIRD
jgi:SAM-dependent methyltransferase